MSTNKKRDRKQKKKLAEKRQNARLAESLAYLGNKYKTDELAPTWMHTDRVKGSSFVRKPFSGPREDAIMRLVKTLASRGSLDGET